MGKSVTAGCVRMINSDVEELYTIVPEGTEVEILD
ncbi:MAG: L,D-transpeptidase family protein [Candidatus Omnitrophota bacterium]